MKFSHTHTPQTKNKCHLKGGHLKKEITSFNHQFSEDIRSFSVEDMVVLFRLVELSNSGGFKKLPILIPVKPDENHCQRIYLHCIFFVFCSQTNGILSLLSLKKLFPSCFPYQIPKPRTSKHPAKTLCRV